MDHVTIRITFEGKLTMFWCESKTNHVPMGVQPHQKWKKVLKKNFQDIFGILKKFSKFAI